ncbi:ArsR/SmtB family transcription factor [Micropruina sp.]|uniref:ArsR/SmtB family transcription factor n=1 Tax=Micropruina sp. TaxID=2737536 RepID=UPI0039E6A401
MADHSPSDALPDYGLADRLDLQHPAQYRALFEPTRTQICSLLLERAATTSELAQVLGKPKGTIGHHLKVLADAGLVTVVRTKRVRALEAKYYGRTARVFWYDRTHDAIGQEERVLAATLAGVRAALDRDAFALTNVRYARVAEDRVREWNERLLALLLEFAAEPPSGAITYAMTVALYATDRAPLPTSEPDQ